MKKSLVGHTRNHNNPTPHREGNPPTIARWRVVWRRRGWSVATSDHYALRSSERSARAFARRLRARRTERGGKICWIRVERQILAVVRPWEELK